MSWRVDTEVLVAWTDAMKAKLIFLDIEMELYRMSEEA